MRVPRLVATVTARVSPEDAPETASPANRVVAPWATAVVVVAVAVRPGTAEAGPIPEATSIARIPPAATLRHVDDQRIVDLLVWRRRAGRRRRVSARSTDRPERGPT